MFNIKLKKRQLHVISAVTFGNTLEWYQAYSYIYLTPVLAKVFFNSRNPESNLLFAFIVFGIGFLIRPLGGFLFGRWGDLLGRKSAFVWSILIITIPTFLMGCLPTHAEWGKWAPFCLILLRLIQSLPESGESPGSFCFLYENAAPENRKFMTSWGAFGNQIGAIIGVFEALILDQFMSEEFLLSWGWRISFWSGAAIGLFGFILRKTLDETPIFKELEARHEIDTETFIEVINNNKKKITIGTAYGIINAATFYLIAAYLPSYFNEMLGLSAHGNALISLSILVLTTVLLPVFGAIGDRFSVKSMMVWSTLLIIVLLMPLYYYINKKEVVVTFVIAYVYIIPITCITALVPFLLLRLFPAPVRFTGVGLTFNLADGFIGGFTPAIAILLTHYTNNQGAFCWFILTCAIISLVSYFKIKE
ncbi:MAG: MFS transporter [Ignavibacteriae bacterium]|nr:MFS transporter [Ignavibacteriota bacterium]